MVWKTSYNSPLGQPPITLAGVDTVQRVAVGTIIKGFDDALGEGEFIYLPGAAGTVAGDAVAYDLTAWTTTRALLATHANQGIGLAVAVAAVPLNSFGWYQISGLGPVNVIAGTVAGRAFLTATAGQLGSAVQAGGQLINARLVTAIGSPTATQAQIQMQRPAVQTQIT